MFGLPGIGQIFHLGSWVDQFTFLYFCKYLLLGGGLGEKEQEQDSRNFVGSKGFWTYFIFLDRVGGERIPCFKERVKWTMDPVPFFTGGKEMKLKIRSKLIIISLILLIVPSLVIGLAAFQTSKSGLNDLAIKGLTNDVHMAMTLITAMDQQVKEGKITQEEAEERVKVQLLGEKKIGKREINKNIDIGKNGHFFVIDKKGYFIADPTMEGKNIWFTEDSNGNQVGKLIVDTALNGGGYVTYDWPFPDDQNRIGTKIVYAEMEPHWGWIVSVGTYMEDFNQDANRILYVLAITIAVSTLIGLAVSMMFARHISKPLGMIAERIKRVADGDLNIGGVRVKNKDEIGQLAHDFQRMAENLREIIGQVTMTSQQVAATAEELSASSEETGRATEQIATSIQNVSTGAERQVESTDQARHVVTEISAGIQQIASSVMSANDSSQEASRTANSGNQEVIKAVEQMKLINEKSIAMVDVVNVLGNKSNEIGKIVSLITEIAEQTNLLALNAAIEAARAGEHGKGFAVVADEVRKLAEQSGKAAGQISQLIREIQNDTKYAVQAMNESQVVVEKGITLVDHAGNAFDNITHAVDKVSSKMQEVSAAVQQINAGTQMMVNAIDEITESVKEGAENTQSVAAATEEQNASIEEIAAVANTLSTMADELQQAVNRFKL